MPGMNSGRGVWMVLLAALLWGTTGTAQSLAPAGLSPYAVGAWRLLLASLFFAAAAARSHHRPLILRGQAGAVVIAGAAMAAYNLAFFAGVRATGVAIGTAVALGSGPIWAGLLQMLLAGRRPSGVWWLGTLLAVAGGVLLVLGGGLIEVSPWGVVLCALAGLSYAVYALVSKRLVGAAAPEIVTLWVFGVAALIAMPLAGIPAWQLGTGWLPGGTQLLMVMYLGVVTCGVAYLLFNHALRHVGGPTAVTLALAEPVVAFTLAVAVLGERPAAAAFAGLALVVMGLLVVVKAELRR
jgi:drug/metabolite transporter, DME family